jgi:NTP pyrophosphatase (non-canonical NTP hydrolase)
LRATSKSRRKSFLGDVLGKIGEGLADVGRVVVCFVGVLRVTLSCAQREERDFPEAKEKKKRVKRSSVSDNFCLFVGTDNVE